MIAVPLLYFLFMTISSFRQKGWNIAAYMYLLYAITSFFACLYVILLPNSYLSNIEIGIVPTFMYCFLISLAIYPFRRLNLKKDVELKKGQKWFNRISYLYIALFFIMLILFSVNIVNILKNGNFFYMRNQGGISSLGSVNTILRTILIALGELSSLMVFFFFYSITYLNKSKTFNFLLILSSLSMVMLGILNIDRSRVFYWLIISGLAYTIFQPHFTKKLKRNLILIMIPFLILLLFYFMIVSISRFDTGDSTLQGGLISYAGQPFLQFCDFFNTYEPKEINFHFFFPNIYHFFIDGYSTSVELGFDIEEKTGRFVNVFYTFLGSIMLDSGKFFMIVFVFLLMFVTIILTKGGNNDKRTSFWRLMRIFLLALIPTCGIISYYISSAIVALGFYFLMILSIWGDTINSKKSKFI